MVLSELIAPGISGHTLEDLAFLFSLESAIGIWPSKPNRRLESAAAEKSQPEALPINESSIDKLKP